MRVLVALVVGLGLALLIFLFTKEFSRHGEKGFFYTVSVEGADFQKTVEELKEELNEEGLKVIKTLTLSKALRARGVEDFPDYYLVLACGGRDYSSLLVKDPSLTNLLPCTVAVYRQGDRVKLSVVREDLFLNEKKLSPQEVEIVRKVYKKLKEVLKEVAR
ncbi:MAG: DUF302 domain-containing protein [Aquificae bacterium]|nr:DUF302 domain-containing protein [Aquificota bacterium]